MKKIPILLGIIFISIGLFTIFVLNNTSIFNFRMGIKNPRETYATITRIDNEDVYIKYDVNGEEYERKANFYSSDMEEGEEIKIIYEKDNPKKFNIKIQDYFDSHGNFFNMKYIFYIVPGIFILIGTILLLLAIFSGNRNKKLLNTGLMLMAKIQSVEYNPFVNINGRHPYVIRASFTYNNLIYETKSENLWFDAKYIIDTFGITEVSVYIDPDNPKKNIIDTREIKSKLGN